MKLRKYNIALYLLLLAGLISGCTDSSSNPSTKTIAMISEDKLDEVIFPKDKVIDVNITIDEADFQSILDNPTAEEYVQADVNYNGYLLENIGLRTKGNSSLRSVAGMSESDRYSFKLSLDEYVTQSIGGITKINLNNEYSDASYMREFLAYEIADSFGIATPKYSFVNIYINGELWGLYTAVEQMSTSFIERQFDSTAGTLYKSNGGNGAELSALASFDEYTGLDVKHGQANEQALLDMTDALNNGDVSSIDDVLDVDAALRFIAFNTVTANMDSYAGNFKHNYYLYELDGRFTIIPWDLNMSFGGFGGSGILIDEPTGVALDTRPLIAELIAEDAYQNQYHALIEELIAASFSEDNFSTRVAELRSLIDESVKNDPTAFVTYEEYEQGVTSLLSFVTTQVDSINKQLSGEIESYGDGSGSASNGGPGGMGGMGGMSPPDGMEMPEGFSPPDGMEMPEGFSPPDGMEMPEGFSPPDGMEMPQGFSPPDGMEMPEGFSPPDGMEMPQGFSPSDGMEMPQGFSPSDGNPQAVNSAVAPEGTSANDEQATEEGNRQVQSNNDINAAAEQAPTQNNEANGNRGNAQAPNMGNGEAPAFGGGRGQGGNFGGGFDGGNSPFGNNGSNGTAVSSEDQQQHFQATIISIILLFAGCFIVLFWRRKS